MTFTQNSDVYVAIYEAGINRVVRHFMRQRPSFFNYGTSFVAAHPLLLGQSIDAAPEVLAAANPLIAVIDPLPVFYTNFKLDFGLQLTGFDIDFYPGNVISLPPALNPPLPLQQLVCHVIINAGLSSPSSTTPSPGTFVLPTSSLRCFTIDIFTTCGCEIDGVVGNQKILPKVDGIDIAELQPVNMEKSIETYALLALNEGLLPAKGEAISNIAFNTISIPHDWGTLKLSASTSVVHNPAIEDDQLKIFIDLDDINLTLSSLGQNGSSNSNNSDTVTRTTRNRTRTDDNDLTAAVSANAFSKVFSAFVDSFTFSKSGSGTYGRVSASYTVAAHLEDGAIELDNTGKIIVRELKIKWDQLRLDIAFDIPTFCVGGFCLFPPWPLDKIWGCKVKAPEVCFFEDNPDFTINLDLSGLITSEITLSAMLRVFYGVGSGVPNRWQVVAVPTLPIDLEIIDFDDSVGGTFTGLVNAAIDNLLSGAPEWAKDLVKAWLGPVENIIEDIMGITGDIGNWLIDLIESLGIFHSLTDELYNYLAVKMPAIFELPDPFTVLPTPEGSTLIPVKMPIDYIGLEVNSQEMVIKGDIGD